MKRKPKIPGSNKGTKGKRNMDDTFSEASYATSRFSTQTASKQSVQLGSKSGTTKKPKIVGGNCQNTKK